MSKKQKKRDTEKYPALIKKYNLKSRQDEIESDYLNQLTSKQLKWLNKFNEEYINANLDREELKNNLHNTKQLKQSCDKRNNDRRNCVYTKFKMTGRLDHFDDLSDVIIEDYEDMLIRKLDDEDEF